jgi:CRISPR/Cas system-associated exonuclease Cas4 (RecB family)
LASKLLTKSKYLYGVQCPRLLWISTNQPELIPRPDAATQFIFDQGQQVGELAKKLFPDGIDIPHDSFMGNINETKELLASRKPLFEAGVMSGRLFSRTDILNPSIGEEWDIIEVKSSTEVKDINVHDVAFQKVCWEESGIKIGRTFLAYINNKYVKNGEISPEEFFFIEDITERVEEISDSTRDRIYEMLRILNQPDCPDALLGACCSDPYDCALMDACHAELPEHNVFTLYYGGKKACALYDNGIVEINDIPDDYKLSDKQQIQRSCLAGNSVYIDKNGIKDFLGTLKYPLYYLDFETFNTAVPLYDGTRPYQNIPFQFSLHVQEEPGGNLNHYWYLASGDADPRTGLISALRNYIGGNGSIVAYNKSFEENVLKELAAAFPEYAEWINGILPRFIDLITPFREFDYYNPLQHGSASLKKVLPAITGSGYEGMNIAKGDDASLAYLEMASAGIDDEKIIIIRENLLAYCGLDTEAMARIIEKLYQII